MKKTVRVFFVFSIFSMLFASLLSCGPGSLDFYIFDDISECEKIQHLEYEVGRLTKYDNPKSDENLKELSYNDFFAAKYESDEVEFEIYAYVFDSKQTSQQYFKNSTGKDDNLEINFLASKGLKFCKITVISGERAYTVLGSRSQFETIKKLLGEIFSVKLTV